MKNFSEKLNDRIRKSAKDKKELLLASQKYNEEFKSILESCLKELYLDKYVIDKKGRAGILKTVAVESNAPYIIKFFPLKKNGEVSRMSIFCCSCIAFDPENIYEVIEKINDEFVPAYVCKTKDSYKCIPKR